MTTLDSWYRPLSGRVASETTGWIDIDRKLIVPVADSHLASSIAMLESKSVINLELEKAIELTGSRTIRTSDTKPYLLRAVVLGQLEGGAIGVMANRDDVEVRYRTLGHSPRPMKRHPIVAWLSREPRNVYVTAQVAE